MHTYITNTWKNALCALDKKELQYLQILQVIVVLSALQFIVRGSFGFRVLALEVLLSTATAVLLFVWFFHIMNKRTHRR